MPRINYFTMCTYYRNKTLALGLSQALYVTTKRRRRQLIFLIGSYLLFVTSLFAQTGGYIQGAVSATQYSYESYTLILPSGESSQSLQWQANEGSIVGSPANVTQVGVEWDVAGSNVLKVTYRNNYGNVYTVNLTVIVTPFYSPPVLPPPPVPDNPVLLSPGCGTASLPVLQRVGGPSDPTHTWYWQGKNYDGTSTAHSGMTYVADQGPGLYYIRAYNYEYNNWSAGSGLIQVQTQQPAIWYADEDMDGFGDPNSSIGSCLQPQGYVRDSSDQCPLQSGSASGCPTYTISDENYIHTINPKIPVADLSEISQVSDRTESIVYLDGLGRPMQNVNVHAGGGNEDLITHIDYDAYGRQSREYLPYAIPTEGGSYRTGDIGLVTQAYYNTQEFDYTLNPYTEKEIESSPLGKTTRQAAPGNDWALGVSGQPDHSVKIEYIANTVADGVRHYRAVAGSISAGYYPAPLSSPGDYTAGELFKTITKDENWVAGTANTAVEFKNRQGKIVLKRTFGESVVGYVKQFIAHDTYYVYDQYGNLSYVLPPISDGSGSIQDLDGNCYQYRYDYRNRLVEKKLPGKDWEFIVYDKLDRVVATGPALNPFGDGTKGWLFTKYDAFNRPVYNGWYNGYGATSADRTTIQTILNGTGALSESRTAPSNINNIPISYTNDAFPKISILLLGIIYYDDYGFPGAAPVPTAVFGEPILRNVKGLSTGSWTRVLTGATQYLGEQSTVFYDGKARPVRSYLKNYLGGYTQSDSKIDFSGKIHYAVTEHKRTASATPTTIREDFAYSDQDRLLTHTHQINNNPPELLAKNEYDELGQLVLKSVGRTEDDPLQKVDYRYNIRGWLLGINDILDLKPATENDLFAYKVSYNEIDEVAGYHGTRLYNGNISETYWKTRSDVSVRKYAYRYDALNRLEEAIYQRPFPSSPHPNCYGESLSYDKNGNIQTLARNGNMESEVYAQPIDALEYTYHPDKKNQLVKVYDSTLEPVGFSDGNSGNNTDYAYDEFGNMTGDLNKGIDLIAYNHLNLPVSISFSNGGRIEYLYTASGSKVQKKVFIPAPSQVGGSVITAMDYLGGFQYQDNVLKHFPTAEGYVSHVSGSYQYVFNYTDHLGNIRLSYGWDTAEAKLKIMEENHYYPFGMKHANYNTHTLSAMKMQEGNEVTLKAVAAPSTPKPVMGYNYKYNGKEFQDELGLNLYDYGARNYDPAIGRWMNMDNLSENSLTESTYTYCGNNPIIFKDPDGNDKRYFDIYGEELVARRVVSDKVFETHIARNSENNFFTNVPMPNIIQERIQSYEDVSGSEYQENDYIIAARTGLFNQTKNSGNLQLYTEGGDAIPKDEASLIPDLDPTLVKAIAIQESHNGTTGVKDIMTANGVGSDFKPYKTKYGLSKNEKLGKNRSLYLGIRFLATKGFRKGITYDNKSGKKTYTFQGWLNAAGSYNGGGVDGYQGYVEDMIKSSIIPTPNNYFTDKPKTKNH